MLKSRPVLWAIPAITVVLAAGAWAVRGATSPQKEAAPETPAVTAVALVRQDLTESISLTGKLGYGTARPVKGGRAGVVTWLPAAGAVISRGKALYRIDDKPVPLFYGSLPLFRTLAQPNTVGRDVRVVRDNLKALGYPVGRQYAAGDRVRQVTPPSPSSGASPGQSPGPSAPAEVWTKVRAGEDVYTSALMNAVKRWQDDAGLPVTGALGAGDVAVLTGPVRVDAVSALVGDPAESPLMSVTPTAKAVTVQAEVSEAGSIHRGDKADVRQPDERTVPGNVAAVATTVQAER
ncbi:hypothetical protein, partial [Actinoplanes philippinensis]|uniref:hypothetical protein n=1 Tax=Actinoplanes philippinensis TaxID=35752 RepID=UPI003492EFD1